MFFDSEFNKKPKISFSSKSQQEQSKDLFLQQAEKQRKDRQSAKDKELKSVFLQSVVRSWKDLKTNRNVYRQLFDSEDRLALLNNNIKAPTSTTLHNSLRRLLFFYNENKDQEKLDFFVSLVTQNMKSFQPNSPDHFCFLPLDSTVQTLLRIRKLLVISQARLPQMLNIHLEFLSIITNPLSWPSASVQDQKKTMRKFLDFMVEKNFLTVLRSLLDKFIQSLSKAPQLQGIIDLLIILSCRPFLFDTIEENRERSFIYTRFCDQILSIPNISAILSVNSLSILSQNLPLVLNIDFSKQNLDKLQIQNLIANISSIGKAFLITVDPKQSSGISKISLFVLALTNLLKLLPSDVLGTMELGSKTFQQLSILWDKDFIKAMWSFLPSKDSLSNVNVPIEAVFGLCSFYNFILKNFKDMKNQVVTTLAFSTSIVPNLWNLILSHNGLQSFLDSIPSIPNSTNVNTGLAQAIWMFTRCYEHLLRTIDDSEFFKSPRFFQVSDHLPMVQMLKKLVVSMFLYWPENFLFAKNDWKNLRKSVISLLSSLHDRNSRITFIPNEVWVAEEFHKRNLKQENGGLFGLRKQDEMDDPVLNNAVEYIPFVLTFEKRVEVFMNFLARDRDIAQPHIMDKYNVQIRRPFIVEDSFSRLAVLKDKFKKLIRIEMIADSGLPEAGIDGGGVFKEFMTELIKRSFDTQYGLFKESEDRLLYPNPISEHIVPEHLEKFEFLGMIVGKAMYENILVELPFANFFLAKLLGKTNFVDDLASLDSQLLKNLQYLKTATNVEDLSLNFTVTEDILGQPFEKELIPDGKNISVTNENKLKYMYLVANYKLNLQIKQQSLAFLRGFEYLIDRKYLRMFNQQELQTLLSGTSSKMDVNDLRQNCSFAGGYSPNHPVILELWKVLESMTIEEQRQFLMFCTSCSRPPLLGFSRLSPPLRIHQVIPENGPPDDYLPTAATCMNFLKLPPYSTAEIMKSKLLYAIQSKSGFELS